MGNMWHLLRKRTERLDGDLRAFVYSEVAYQDKLEATGYKSPSWRVLRALQGIQAAIQLQVVVYYCRTYVKAVRGDKGSRQDRYLSSSGVLDADEQIFGVSLLDQRSSCGSFWMMRRGRHMKRPYARGKTG